ncbi:chloride channel protein [Flavitalea sp.]|nr:chloride channel protein [Flavitalea sp.]
MSRFKMIKTSIRDFVSSLYFLLPSSIITGLLVALFLWLLEWVTSFRFSNNWLIYLLPFAGILITWLYEIAGKNASAGNDLIIDEIHKPGAGVPARITPLILITTLITHLFGGSAGREGTAIQMGGGVAAYFSRMFSLSPDQRSLLLMSGIAAGFGAVFGTPLAGAVFAIEVLTIGKLKYNAFFYCLISSVAGDLTCRLTGIHHTSYFVSFIPAGTGPIRWISTDIFLLLKVIMAAIIFGYTSRLFTGLSHFTKSLARFIIPNKWLRPVVGGSLVIGISYLVGSFDFLGLGVSNPAPGSVSILSAFQPGGAGYLSWFWKMLLTVITLSFGFKGGEVTPLFFVGATLGNVLAVIFGAPVDLFAAIGFIAVFAGATNTPLACTIMGVELFGSDNILFYAVACITAYFFSGRAGIYTSQR